jgi:hypothetical protein
MGLFRLGLGVWGRWQSEQLHCQKVTPQVANC